MVWNSAIYVAVTDVCSHTVHDKIKKFLLYVEPTYIIHGIYIKDISNEHYHSYQIEQVINR